MHAIVQPYMYTVFKCGGSHDVVQSDLDTVYVVKVQTPERIFSERC